MTAATQAASQRLFVPEVVQTSSMDCGPAALKALLEGFGIPVSYGKLREACQTDVDGTSIDVIEETAVKLGLDAAQFMVPVDHLLMQEADALPAIVVTRLPNGLTHFVVVWRTHRQIVQVMDPGAGRLWRTRRRFLRDVFVHSYPVPEPTARAWLTAQAFLDPLRRRLSELGLSPDEINDVLDDTLASDEWLPVAALDAAARLTSRILGTKAIPRDRAASLVKRLADGAARLGAEGALKIIPPHYWSVLKAESGDLALIGAVIVHVAGRRPQQAATEEGASPELAAALAGEGPKPMRSILQEAFRAYPLALVGAPVALVLAGACAALEGVLFNGLVSVANATGQLADAHRMLWLVVSFLWIVFLLNISVSAVLLHFGHWLDLHLRVRLLEKLPRLGNYYFHSRLKSDLAQRAHELRSLRHAPHLVSNGLRVVSELAVTAAGIIWLVPSGALAVALALIAILGPPLALFPVMREQELRCETHAGALMRFHLDSLLGLTPIRAHGAQGPVRAEHESLLVQWVSAIRDFYWTHLGGLAAALLTGTLCALWAVSKVMEQGAGSAISLLVVYWALKLPVLAQQLGTLVRQAPASQNRLLRLFEVLHASEETELTAAGDAEETELTAEEDPEPAPPKAVTAGGERRQTGVHVIMRGVGVHAAGRRILSDVDLEIRRGEHVAVVGPSGSGKTTLAGLLLGWHRASPGAVWIDGELAKPEQIKRLRRQIAWVDPAVQIWNRSLEQNLRYGNGDELAQSLRSAIASADLNEVVERLPEGLETRLGEGGGLVSGGEGQRVRLARAMLRKDARLVILDEPFRGLDADKRHELLAEARRRWSGATLLYISHDIGSTLELERVLVVEEGRIVEDGAPRALLDDPGSRFSALKRAEDDVHNEVWGSPVWRRWRMERGELRGGGDKASP